MFTFFSCGYLDVSVPRVRSPKSSGVTGSLPPGCPIRISAAMTGICPSPRLFAACHVLLRLREPRHPPCALFTTRLLSSTFVKRSFIFIVVYLRLLRFRSYHRLRVRPFWRRRSLWLCLTLGLFRLAAAAALFHALPLSFQPCHCPLSLGSPWQS